VAATGCDVEVVPGILPVTSFSGLQKFASNCGATIPSWMYELFDGLDDHPATRQLVAATVAAEFCRRLYDGGVREFHFYTLNRAELSYAICHMLGARGKRLEIAA
jgi:methylenetetrahydrofolate reductase (NADPH)